MNKYLILFLPFTLFLFSCIDKREKNTGQEKIPVDISQIHSREDVFSKIELIPMETNDSILVGSVKKVCLFNNQYYVFLDKKLVIYIFDKSGNFISNSTKVMGQGPNEYLTALDVAYNNKTGNIEILNPNNRISIYDIWFSFKEKRKINFDDFMFHHFMPVNDGEYILLPTTFSNKYNWIYFYDVASEKITQKIKYENVAKLTQTKDPIRNINGRYYFNPPHLTYSGYEINPSSLDIERIFELDFDKQNVDKKRLKRFNSDREISDFLAFESDYPLPLRTFFNDQYVISSIRMSRKYYTLIHNIQTKQSIILDNNQLEKKYRIPDFFAIEDNALIACVQPFNLEKYINIDLVTDKKLLNEILNNGEDDNPIIVKYYIE